MQCISMPILISQVQAELADLTDMGTDRKLSCIILLLFGRAGAPKPPPSRPPTFPTTPPYSFTLAQAKRKLEMATSFHWLTLQHAFF